MNVRQLLLSTSMLASTMLYAQLPSAQSIAGQMYPGWNLGNTLEAGSNTTLYTTDSNGGLGQETSWQGTKTTQAVIDYVKAQGFRSVRIPCSWVMGHISDSASLTIDSRWMARVREVVDYCIADGLYVVLNDHWDGGWMENNLSAYTTENATRLRSLWTQIATEFRDYDEHLLFAGFNEPACDNSQAYQVLMRYEQDFVDIVRATGGNNASRTLVVQGPSTDITKTVQNLKMPTDVISDRLMVEVHYYTPPQFTGVWENGTPYYFWGSSNHISSGTWSSYNATWGEESYLKEQLKSMYDSFASKGYPVLLGEYGANWRSLGNTAAQKKHDASIKLFNQLICQYSVDYGIVPCVWDINVAAQNGTTGVMTVLNRNSLSVFCTPAMEGITAGCAAGTWPLSSGLQTLQQGSTSDQSDQSYNLTGQRTNAQPAGLCIVNNCKLLFR